jgi:periodic tryptophan protein 1
MLARVHVPAARAETDGSIEAALAELDMEHYDDDGDEDAGAARLFGGSGRPTYYASNEEDPYITLHEEEDEEELSDFTLRPTGASASTQQRRRGRRGDCGVRRAA